MIPPVVTVPSPAHTIVLIVTLSHATHSVMYLEKGHGISLTGSWSFHGEKLDEHGVLLKVRKAPPLAQSPCGCFRVQRQRTKGFRRQHRPFLGELPGKEISTLASV